MRLKFAIDPKESRVRGAFTLAHRYQGPPKAAHGGIVASVVDEAMGKLSRLEGVVALTAELSVEYLHPVPLGRKIIVEAHPVEQNGRNYWRECSIRDTKGKVLVRGKGRFVKVAIKGDPFVYE
ncbi:MAG: PaaI family thioesterase [Acidobacteria bacterium]|nr:PaaI family thioesterase [Acidobacteriota bacterium]